MLIEIIVTVQKQKYEVVQPIIRKFSRWKTRQKHLIFTPETYLDEWAEEGFIRFGCTEMIFVPND
jgi:hypothetical protein